MSRRTILNGLVALVAILITGGLAAAAVVGGPTSDRSDLVATGLEAPTVVGPASTVTTTVAQSLPPGSTRPAVTPRAPGMPQTTPLLVIPPVIENSPETTLASPPPVVAAPAPAPAAAVPPAALPPTPVLTKTGPASWKLVANGVTVHAGIDPVDPQVGDTVTIAYTTSGEGDFCCLSLVLVDGTVVGQSEEPGGACPVDPVTSGSATVVMTEPGPFTFQVQATRVEQLCVSPPSFDTANLFATFPVLPADPA